MLTPYSNIQLPWHNSLSISRSGKPILVSSDYTGTALIEKKIPALFRWGGQRGGWSSSTIVCHLILARNQVSSNKDFSNQKYEFYSRLASTHWIFVWATATGRTNKSARFLPEAVFQRSAETSNKTPNSAIETRIVKAPAQKNTNISRYSPPSCWQKKEAIYIVIENLVRLKPSQNRPSHLKRAL